LADGFALLAIVAWTLYAALGTNVFGKTPWPETMVDYHLLYSYSWEIVEKRTYSAHHAYPPSAIVMHFATAQFPFRVSAVLYLLLTILSALACWWLLLRMLKLDRSPGGPVLAMLALVFAYYYFLWDLQSQNCNLIFLLSLLLGALYLSGSRPLLAGFWLAFSFSLKLFSLFLIPYLLWKGHYRAFCWTVVFIVVFWVLLPFLVFGGTGIIEVYQNWLLQMKLVSTNQVDLNHPILISLHNSAYWLSEHNGPGMGFTINAFRVVWLGLVLAGLAASRFRADMPGDSYGMLADISLLILAPIAVSPYLEPYHGVPAAIPAILLLAAATDIRQRPRIRLVAGLFFLAALALAMIPNAWEIRGLIVNLRLLTATSGAVAVAWLRQLPRTDGVISSLPSANSLPPDTPGQTPFVTQPIPLTHSPATLH
jgi:Glycosyltransferase family 87